MWSASFDSRRCCCSSCRFRLSDGSNLAIETVHIADRGIYQCVATNIAGSRESKEAHLTVNGEQKRPYSGDNPRPWRLSVCPFFTENAGAKRRRRGYSHCRRMAVSDEANQEGLDKHETLGDSSLCAANTAAAGQAGRRAGREGQTAASDPALF